ncbi:MAG: S24/S26 family peptidase [Prevotella sp.]|nr:S24/S26 family peptidase [Prevotella sp.]
MSSNPPKTHSHQPAAKELQIENRKFLPEVIKLLNEGHTVTLLLKGFSMRPFLEDNRDKALLAKAKDIQVGDAVLAETAPKHYVLHRIIKIQGDTVTLRGDGNLGTEVCHINDVHGLAIGFYRKGRTKLDKTNGIKWRTYSHIWMALYPIRRYLLAAYRRIWIPLFGPI